MADDTKPDTAATATKPIDLSPYDSGFVDGYLASRGMFDTSSKEIQRALAALERFRKANEATSAS